MKWLEKRAQARQVTLGETSPAEVTAAEPEVDPVVNAILNQNGYDGSTYGGVAALETAAGVWSRAFLSANVSPSNYATDTLNGIVLAQIARCMCVRGESLHLLTPQGLMPVGTWDIKGGPNEASWVYAVDMAGPSMTRTVKVGSESVIHCRYATHPARPWRGLSPLRMADQTRDLAGRLERGLTWEANSPTGTVIFSGNAQSDATVADELREGNLGASNPRRSAPLKILDAFSRLKGGMLVANTNRDEGTSFGLPNDSPTTERVGMRPQPEVTELRKSVYQSVLSACGVHPALAGETSAGALREAWRVVLHGTLSPVSKIIAAECGRKLGVPGLQINFGELYASDVTGRARALKGLVEAGVELNEARKMVGF